jgi:hypothetical protein
VSDRRSPAFSYQFARNAPIPQNEHECLIVFLRLYFILRISQMATLMSVLELKDGMQGAVLGFALSTLMFFIVIGVGSLLSTPRRRGFRNPYPSSRYDQHQWPDPTDAAQQLYAVMAASFEKQKVLNKQEYRVFKIVEAEAAAARKDYRVLAQTNLGEILHTRDKNAYRSINSKRVDILVIDWAGLAIVAIEYQGRGHYLQGNAAARDAVKKEALRKAGVAYLEFVQSDSEDQIRSRVREQLGWIMAMPADGKSSPHANVVPAQ